VTLDVTEGAAGLLEERLKVLEHEPGQLLRLIVKPDGLGLTLDTEREDDQVVEHQGRPVMLVEPELGDRLSGFTLDVVAGPDGQDFTLN
jgi:Fe-S cluster assembly iron-binding protein IscA